MKGNIISKYKVGDKFKVLHSETTSQDLNVDTVHTIVDVMTLHKSNNIQFYATDTGWFLEEGETDNTLLVSGMFSILAVLSKIEEPDT